MSLEEIPLMHNIKLVIAYDGTDYYGWQKTCAGPSVESFLQEAIERALQTTISLQAASRTDAGVHAEAQVVNFLLDREIDLGKFVFSVNRMLGRSIVIQHAEFMPIDFHPTLDCRGKIYRYDICNQPIQNPPFRLYSWHYPYELNASLMKSAAEMLTGTHDFSAFCNFKKNSNYENCIRTVSGIEITPESGKLSFSIEGTNFLYKMVRNLVGTIIYVGNGKLSLGELPEILSRGDRTLAGITAPAHGLFLEKVIY